MKRASCKSRMPMSKAPTGAKRGHHWGKSKTQNPRSIERADDGIRTRDLRFTKPLLYQLSYVGASGKDDIRRLPEQARRCSGNCVSRLICCSALDASASTSATQMSRQSAATQRGRVERAARFRNVRSVPETVRD